MYFYIKIQEKNKEEKVGFVEKYKAKMTFLKKKGPNTASPKRKSKPRGPQGPIRSQPSSSPRVEFGGHQRRSTRQLEELLHASRASTSASAASCWSRVSRPRDPRKSPSASVPSPTHGSTSLRLPPAEAVPHSPVSPEKVQFFPTFCTRIYQFGVRFCTINRTEMWVEKGEPSKRKIQPCRGLCERALGEKYISVLVIIFSIFCERKCQCVAKHWVERLSDFIAFIYFNILIPILCLIVLFSCN